MQIQFKIIIIVTATIKTVVTSPQTKTRIKKRTENEANKANVVKMAIKTKKVIQHENQFLMMNHSNFR